MLEDSEDSVVKTIQATLKTGRKWKVVEATDQAEECLNTKELIGQTQTDRKMLGSSVTKQKGTRKETSSSMRFDSRRVQKAVQQPPQGQWTNWDNALQKSLTWNYIWYMAPLWISFPIRSVYYLLPSNANLVRWGKKEDDTCPLCPEGGAKSWHGRAVKSINHRKCLLDGCDDWKFQQTFQNGTVLRRECNLLYR